MKLLDLLNPTDSRKKVKVGKVVRVLPGGRKAIYETNVGLVRKPYPDPHANDNPHYRTPAVGTVKVISSYPEGEGGNRRSRRADAKWERGQLMRDRKARALREYDLAKEARLNRVQKRHEENRSRAIDRRNARKAVTA